MKVVLRVNGAPAELDVEPDTMLLEVLRDRLGLLGARGTCGLGVCGACTVLLDGRPVSSCIMLAPLAGGHEVTTVEGLPDDDPVVRAFDRHRAFQCGYCTPGMVLTCKAFLAERAAMTARAAGGGGGSDSAGGAGGSGSAGGAGGADGPSRAEIATALGGNLCRCGCYVKIIDAVREVGL